MGFLTYPAKGMLRGQRGLNLVDYLLNLGPDSKLKANNLYFFRRTERRRHGFQRYSTEDWSDYIWRGGHEFLDDSGNARLLVARDNGHVEEVQDPTTHASVLTGLAANRETYFATGFGVTFAVNGDDLLRRLDATSNPATPCTGRIAGVPAPPSIAVTAGAAGGQTGDYLFCATAVMEDGLGDPLLESDWSDLFQITLLNQKQSGTVTPGAVDTRVTHFYIYRTDASGAQPKYFTKVTAASPVFTDVSVADTALGIFPPTRGLNIAPPDSPELLALAGSRLFLAKGRTLYGSSRSLNAYDCEAFPYQVEVPGAGSIKMLCSVPNPGGTPGTNALLIGMESSTYILFGSDPTQPLTELTPGIGIMSSAGIVIRGGGVFWVDRKRGVMWWPGEGKTVYSVGDRIGAVITGDGYQGVSPNLGDGNVSLSIWKDNLLLTVRDDSAKACGNKVYTMGLIAFEQLVANAGPEASAVWGGPWEGPGFYRFIPRIDGSLILLDNENRYLSVWDATTFKDYIAGVDVGAQPIVQLGTCLSEILEMNKRIHQVYLVAYANADSTLRLIGEESRFDIPDIALSAASYGDIPFEDIDPVDIPVAGQAWKSEGEIDWSAVAEWVRPEFATTDEDNDWIWVGTFFLYTRVHLTRTYA